MRAPSSPEGASYRRRRIARAKRRCAADHGCAVKRSDSNGGERPTSLILSQQDGGAEASLIRVVPGVAGAALTDPGRASTARWFGFGERDGEEYARNRCVTPP